MQRWVSVVAYTFNPSTWEVKARGSQIWDQFELHIETLWGWGGGEERKGVEGEGGRDEEEAAAEATALPEPISRAIIKQQKTASRWEAARLVRMIVGHGKWHWNAKTLKLELPFYPTTPLLGINLKALQVGSWPGKMAQQEKTPAFAWACSEFDPWNPCK